MLKLFNMGNVNTRIKDSVKKQLVKVKDQIVVTVDDQSSDMPVENSNVMTINEFSKGTRNYYARFHVTIVRGNSRKLSPKWSVRQSTSGGVSYHLSFNETNGRARVYVKFASTVPKMRSRVVVRDDAFRYLTIEAPLSHYPFFRDQTDLFKYVVVTTRYDDSDNVVSRRTGSGRLNFMADNGVNITCETF